MRIATRNLLLLVGFYVAAVSLVAVWAKRELAEASDAIMGSTAELLGAQIVLVAADLFGDELAGGVAANRRALLNELQRIQKRTDLIQGIELVNENGEVFSSDELIEIGARRARPELVFGPEPEPYVITRPRTGGTTFVLAVPLSRDDRLIGYVRVELVSRRIEALYADSVRRLGAVAALALVLVGAIGVTLHVSLQRASEGLVSSVEGALGEALDERRGSFAAAAAAVERLGERFRSERELRAEVSDRISQLERSLDVGLCLVDAQGRVRLATKRARELLGLGGEASPEDWKVALGPLRPAIDRLVSGDAATPTAELELDTASGSLVRCRLAVVEGGTGVLAQFGDRGALEAVETDLQQAAQLRSLTQLYIGVAHDLRAPLNAVMMHLELWRHFVENADLPDQEREKQGRRLHLVETEIERLRRLLEVLLAQTAPASTERRRFDLGEMVDEVAALLEPQARQQRVEVAREIDEAPVEVWGLRDQIKQAIVNVAVNALEAMPEGGRLVLRVTRADDEAVVDVADTGPGIPPELRDRIFDMRVTSKATGSGLGLFVSRSILEAQGGRIAGVSTGDDGTTFSIVLPLAGDRQRAATAAT